MDPGIIFPRLDERGYQQVRLSVNRITYGRYYVISDSFDAPPGYSVRNYRIPFNFDLIEGILFISPQNEGDMFRFLGFPKTCLNAVSSYMGGPSSILSSPVNQGDKSIVIIPSLLGIFADKSLIEEGRWEITLKEGDNEETVDAVSSYDRISGVVELSNIKKWTGTDEPPSWEGFNHSYSISALVYVTRVFVDWFELPPLEHYIPFGSSAHIGSPVPKNIIFSFEYINNSDYSKRVRLRMDLMTGKQE